MLIYLKTVFILICYRQANIKRGAKDTKGIFKLIDRKQTGNDMSNQEIRRGDIHKYTKHYIKHRQSDTDPTKHWG